MKSKNYKREQAEKRQAVYDSLSDMEKLALIQSRPGSSARERARILKRLT